MKLYLFLSVLATLIACNHSKNYDSIAFDYIPESKAELKRDGYSNRITKDKDGKETVWANVFQKNINDTFVEFLFEKERLLEKKITFSYKRFDSAQLIKDLENCGLHKIPADSILPYAFYHPEKEWKFDVHRNPKQFVLSLQLARQKRMSMPAEDSSWKK